MRRCALICLSSIFFCSCGISQSEYSKMVSERDSLTTEVEALKKEIEELNNGEERLINLAENAYKSNEYIKTKLYIDKLLKKHPESSKITYFKNMLVEIEPKVQDELEKIEKQRKDSIRLANINELGIWQTDYYVNDFDEPTKEGYVKTSINGTFSNSATTNSDLRVGFIIDKNSIRIQLYEYARNHPIKGEGFLEFTIKDSNNKIHTVKSYNSDSGNNTIEEEYFDEVKAILLNGGRIKFVALADKYGSPSEYKFEIVNADYLENALTKISGNAE